MVIFYIVHRTNLSDKFSTTHHNDIPLFTTCLKEARSKLSSLYGKIEWYVYETAFNGELDPENGEPHIGTKLDVTKFKPLDPLDREWKYIPGFFHYMASDLGEILNMRLGNYTPGITAGHYLKVNIRRNRLDKGKMEYVHILVATTYHGYKKGFVVGHKDDNKHNNDPDNLSWITQSQNIKDAWANGLVVAKENLVYSW